MTARGLLLTRPEEQARAFAAAVAARLPGRFEAVIAPLTRIAALPGGALDLTDVSGLLFTSANGVEQFVTRQGAGVFLPAYCVGAMTAAAARAAGIRAVSADGDVEALARLAAGAWRPGDGPLVHVRGRKAAGDLVGRLAELGVPARAAEIYAQEGAPLTAAAAEAFAAGRIGVVTVFSPRSAARLRAALAAGGWPVGGVAAVSLSAAAEAGLGGLCFGARVVAEAPTREGMLAALGRL